MPAASESVPVLRRFARDLARRWQAPDAVDEALAVIITELVANVVRHSGSMDVAVMLAVTDTTLTLQVQDTGRWRARPAAHRGYGQAADEPACSGRGLCMVEAYADSCAVTVTAGGTRVIAELLLPMA